MKIREKNGGPRSLRLVFREGCVRLKEHSHNCTLLPVRCEVQTMKLESLVRLEKKASFTVDSN